MLLSTLLLLSLSSSPAIAYGSGGCGRIEGAVSVPCSGENYEAFTAEACEKRRNFLHPLVVKTITDAFAAVAKSRPSRRWQYGDLGAEGGGKFWPHKTHQNGLAADFFVPVLEKDGAPSTLTITPRNKYGYGLEFNRKGSLGSQTIDWKALGAHLLAIEEAGREHGVTIERVILTPAFHQRLWKEVPELERLKGRFMKKEAWVRHDEHYHVDFTVPAELLRPLKCKR